MIYSRIFLSITASVVLVSSLGCQKKKAPSEDSNKSGELGTVRLKSDTQEKAQAEAWANLHVTEENVRSIWNSSCSSSKELFVTCLFGAQNVLENIDSSYKIFPAREVVVGSRYAVGILFTVNQLAIVRTKSQQIEVSNTIKGIYQQIKKDSASFRDSWGKVYDLDRQAAEKLLPAVVEILTEKNKQDVYGFIYKNFYEGFFRVKDSVTEVEPLSYFIWQRDNLKESSQQAEGAQAIYLKDSILIKSVRDPKNPLRQGDRVMAINGMSLTNHSIFEISEEFKSGDKLVMNVSRNGKTFEVNYQTSQHQAPVSEKELAKAINHKNKKVLSLSLKSFKFSDTCSTLKSKMDEYSQKPLDGIILDLRGNRGGSVIIAQCVAGLFLRSSELLFKIERYNGESESLYPSLQWANQNQYNLPVVVLGDGESASASEAIIGALKLRPKAYFVGQRTFGKGSVNQAFPVGGFGDQVYAYHTAGVFKFANGLTNNRVGIAPDFTVPWAYNAPAEEDEFLHSEDRDNNPSQPSNPMIAARPETELEPIKKCINHDYLKTLHEKYFGTFPGNDHQFNYAFEVIGCVPN